MGIAESISAVGIAGTVTGLSYTQATAQQKEDEEEARRAAEAAQAEAAAAASAATTSGRNNRNKQRSGADESGPSHGAFPVSGNLGGGRRRSRGPVLNGDNGAGKQINGRAVTKGRGAGGKRQATAGQSKRSGDTTRKKGNQLQPPVAADSDVPTSDVPEPPASAGPISTPGRGRRGGGKKRKSANTDAHVVPEEGGPATVAPDIEYTVPNQHQETNLVADPPARQSDKTSSASPSSSREFLPSSSTQGPPSPNTSHLSHQPPGSQTTRQVSRARNRNRKTRTQSRGSTINTTPKPQSLQAASSPGPSHAQPTAQSPADNVSPTPKSSRNDARRRGRGGGRGPQFAHIERSSPLASFSQSNA
ncbi:hypothetical protein C8R42DRAFT_362585 [Lentinula raphanica]|nr:hypothetical protein C8R42DRAFT_362585 [Lentinula raphanica]